MHRTRRGGNLPPACWIIAAPRPSGRGEHCSPAQQNFIYIKMYGEFESTRPHVILSVEGWLWEFAVHFPCMKLSHPYRTTESAAIARQAERQIAVPYELAVILRTRRGGNLPPACETTSAAAVVRQWANKRNGRLPFPTNCRSSFAPVGAATCRPPVRQPPQPRW